MKYSNLARLVVLSEFPRLDELFNVSHDTRRLILIDSFAAVIIATEDSNETP